MLKLPIGCASAMRGSARSAMPIASVSRRRLTVYTGIPLCVLTRSACAECRVFSRSDIVKDWLKMRIDRQRPFEAGARLRVAGERRVDHPCMEIKPRIGGFEPDCCLDMW